ncbi:MAG: DeoR/GlpR transcriptional regulator [Clostridia bacterium]|nr:DeoR/GlpR transcriptional regulator [Clostridia bacterium]
MYKEERYSEILELARENGYVTVEFLVKQVHASPASIRRDLTALEKDGYIRRSYGGASYIADGENVSVPYMMRKYKHKKEKNIIAKKAASLIHDGDIVFIDNSTTASYLAPYLTEKKNITVMSNNMTLIMTLAQHSVEVICTGGHVRGQNSLFGTLTERAFASMRADIGFFSSTALSKKGEILDSSQARHYIHLCEHCDKRVYLCNEEKIGAKARYCIMTLDDVDVVVSDRDIRGELETEFDNVEFI